MPKHIRDGLIVGKGLPTDDTIREWVMQLLLCREALAADIDYDRYTVSYIGELTEDELAEQDAQLQLYTDAIAALQALLEGAE